jgi:SAM-dependent methyltransferase
MFGSWIGRRTPCVRSSGTNAERSGFDPALFAYLAELEPRSFWFRARNRLIVSAVRRHFPHARTLLEVGCGTGFVLAALQEAFPGLHLTGSELFREGLEVAQRRLPEVELIELDATEPAPHTFDVVGAFDVLEHILDDDRALARLFGATAPGGGMILLVPQHASVWSAADEFAHHVRRYTRSDLVAKVERAGFRVTFVTSYVTALLPLLIATRALRRANSAHYDLASELVPPRFLNLLFGWILDGERHLIERGVSFPVGGSLLLVARREATP